MEVEAAVFVKLFMSNGLYLDFVIGTTECMW